MRWLHLLLLTVLGLMLTPDMGIAQKKKPAPKEEDYYRLVNVPIPADVVLEVGGLDWLDAARTKLLACTRRGELWQIDNVYADQPVLAGAKPQVKEVKGKKEVVPMDPAQIVSYKRLLFGLHEPLGVATRPDGIYLAQRGELTRVKLNKNKDAAELVQTFCNEWEISGGYHEFAFGPKVDKEGNFWVTLNRPFGGGQEATAYWRAWAVKIDPKGKMHPVCPGLRSPCGLGANAEGDMFYTDNQGDHVAACKLGHLKPGVFHGNPVGLESCGHPLANFKVPFKGYPKLGLPWPEAVKANPGLLAPAVWFPYPEMGQSHSDLVYDGTGGKFGPFHNQLFVGDLSRAFIVRVCLEKVAGEYQGACFPFRKGFITGVIRMCWGRDGALFVGGTNRGWGGGPRPYGLERLTWTGLTPFEVHEMKATPTGFHLTFTEPIDPQSGADLKSYSAKSWTYLYYDNYGDKQQFLKDLTVTGAAVAADGKSVDLTIDGLRAGYVHEVHFDGLRNRDGQPLLHPLGYYTLNSIPKKG